MTQHARSRGYEAVHVAVLIGALVMTVLLSEEADWQPVELFLVLLAFAIAGALTPVRVGAITFMPTDTPAFVLAAALLGPAPTVAIALTNISVDNARRRVPLRVAIDNLTSFAIFSLVGALLFDALADRLRVEPGGWDFALLVLALYGFVNTLSFTIVATQFRLQDRIPFTQSIRDAWTPVLPLDSIAASLTALVTVGYGQMGIAAVAGVLPFMLLGAHLMRELIGSRERARRITELANGRRMLIARAFDAEDKARRDLAQDLHDNTIQLLLAARQEMDAAQTGDSNALARMNESVEGALKQLRTLSFDLNPAVLRHAGLPAALRTLAGHYAEKAAFEAQVAVDLDGNLAEAQAQLVLALAHELLVNAAKHAAASLVQLTVRHEAGQIKLEVRDDGRGFEPAGRAAAVLEGHIGLASVAERVEATGGSFTLESAPGAGTRVLIELPVDGYASAQ